MIPHELTMCPFDREITGPHGSVLLRRNRVHARESVKAIRRRNHPGWSRFVCGFRVEAV